MEVRNQQGAPPEGQRLEELDSMTAVDRAISSAFDYGRKALQVVLKMAGHGCPNSSLTACIQSHLEKLKEEELLVASQLRVDLGTEKLKKSLIIGRLSELGLNPQQIAFAFHEKPLSEFMDLSPSLKEPMHFSEKFYQVLSKLNIVKPSDALGMTPEEISKQITESIDRHCLEASPVKERIQSLNHTLQYLNEENIKLRCQLAKKESEKLTPTITELIHQLEQEERMDQDKLGILSHEYEQKISRLKGEEAELANHMKDKIDTLKFRVKILKNKLQESLVEIRMLQALIESQNEQLNLDYLEHGMMLEKANQEVQALTHLLEKQTPSDLKNLYSSHSTTASNPLVPNPPLRLSTFSHPLNLHFGSELSTTAAPAPATMATLPPYEPSLLSQSFTQTSLPELPVVWVSRHLRVTTTTSQLLSP
jgi:hypothetical protein